MNRNQRQTRRLMDRGNFIISGGGLIVNQLTTGQYEIRLHPDLMTSIQTGGKSGPAYSSGDSGEPGEPTLPVAPNPIPPVVPVLPDLPNVPPVSGEYGGPTRKGRKIKGATSDAVSGLDGYNFNQQGWQYYLW